LERKKYVKAGIGKFLKEKEKKVKQKGKVNRNFLKITLKINIINLNKKILLLIRRPPALCLWLLKFLRFLAKRYEGLTPRKGKTSVAL
jgi:hypothetical protein